MNDPAGTVSAPDRHLPDDAEQTFVALLTLSDTCALPADLAGRENGELDADVLKPIVGGRLHWRAAAAWAAMWAAAARDGVTLVPCHTVNTYRPLALQKKIFMRRYANAPQPNAEPVSWDGRAWWLKPGCPPAAIPGTSSHGWGLAIKIMDTWRPEYTAWLSRNADRFGWEWHHTEPSYLCYCRGDDVPEAVVAFERQQAERASLPKAICWDADNLLTATHGVWTRAPDARDWKATGVCIAALTMEPGQIAVVQGRAGGKGIPRSKMQTLAQMPAAVVTEDDDLNALPVAPVLRVPNSQGAIVAMGAYARSQMTGRVIGVTGSAGKTSTVSMLTHVLRGWGRVGHTVWNANAHMGIAWNLSSIPWNVPFTVMETAHLDMHLSSQLLRPHVAIVTTLGAAHLDYHGSIEGVAKNKSRIFWGMPPGGIAILNRDMPKWDVFAVQAQRYGLRMLNFGKHEECQLRLTAYEPGTQQVSAEVFGQTIAYRLGAPGEHMAMNSLACLAAVHAFGLSLERALARLDSFRPVFGRGAILDVVFEGKRLRVIDEAYNANPTSMAAALRLLPETASAFAAGRRVLILGDMLDLGPASSALHAALAGNVLSAKPDVVLLCGSAMQTLAAALAGKLPLTWFASAAELREKLAGYVEDGDLVLIKGSNGSGLNDLVTSLGWRD